MATAIGNMPVYVTKEVVNLTRGTEIVSLFMFEEDLVRVNAMSEGSDIQVCCSNTIQGFISNLNNGITRTIYKTTDGCYVDTVSTDNVLYGINVVSDPTSDRRFFVIYNGEVQSVTFTFKVKTYLDGSTEYYYWVSSITASKSPTENHEFRLRSNVNSYGALQIQAGSTTATQNRPSTYVSRSEAPTSMDVYFDSRLITTITVRYVRGTENSYTDSYTVTEGDVKFKP